MVDVRLARTAALVLVGFDGEIKSLVDGFKVLGFLAGLPSIKQPLVSSLYFFFLFFGIGVG
jgi:hypothetical protein